MGFAMSLGIRGKLNTQMLFVNSVAPVLFALLKKLEKPENEEVVCCAAKIAGKIKGGLCIKLGNTKPNIKNNIWDCLKQQKKQKLLMNEQGGSHD